MVTDVIRYGGIHAKICAMKKGFLKYEDYMELAKSDDVKGFAETLGGFPAYKEAAREAIEYGATRVAIERSLLNALYQDYAALYSFITVQNERKYLDVIYVRYAVEIIKRLIRRLFDHRDIRNVIPRYDDFMSKRFGLNVDKLEESQNLEELVESTKGSEIYNVLVKLDKDKATLFDYEMQLDFYIFLKTNKFQEKYLDKKLKVSARHTNGTEVDLLNIIWIYRAKTYYDLSPDRIFTCLIPLHYKLSKESVKELVQAEGREKFLEVLGKTHYKNVFHDLSVDGIEADFRSYMNKLYVMKMKNNPYSLSIIVSHLYFKMQEIKNVTTLIECVRYKLLPEDALKRLSLGYMANHSEAYASY